MPIGPGDKKEDEMLFEEFEDAEEQLEADESLAEGTESYEEEGEELEFEDAEEAGEEGEEEWSGDLDSYDQDALFGSDEPISLSNLSVDESYGEDGLE